ncbi:MAG TPA: helix-turn-helix domain-containing protein, partial [Rubrivivax sp.]|nr:helix-turn-helix domain-containing protein [Rubrivivax sp.]
MLGMAVRSVQLMVDRGELEAWKTPGGHRRISRSSVDRWRASRGAGASEARPAQAVPAAVAAPAARRPGKRRVLLIEDSVHYQNLVGATDPIIR